MRRFLVDLHIHTLLSPCGDLAMSPQAIVRNAQDAELDAIAICDHNTTLQTAVVAELGRKAGLTVFHGVEITSREEVHCVALLPDARTAAQLQKWIDTHILRVKHNPEKLGDQVWVDREEQIAGQIEWYLHAPVNRSIEQTAYEVARIGGLFIPAHVDRPSNSLFGQLGLLPAWLEITAIEYNHPKRFADLCASQPRLEKHTAYTASDAHTPELIGSNPSWLYAEECSFDELRKAFAGQEGRRIVSRRQEP